MTNPSDIYLTRKESGFSLIEMLISTAILLVVTAAIFTLYNTQHKGTHIEADVVDVQQNLKIALESVEKDIWMSGFMVPAGTNPVNSFANNTGLNATDLITLNTATETGVIARINVSLTTNVAAGTAITFTVATAGELSDFSVGDIARILDAGEKGQPVTGSWSVTGKNTGVPSITLNPSGNGTGILFRKGFVIAKTATSAPDTYPNTILYCVGPTAGCGPAVTTCPAGQRCLMRIVNALPVDDSVVATNMQGFQLKYVSDGSAAEVDSPANLSLVRAVRVSIVAATAKTAQLSQGAKTRSLTTIAKIRNR